MIIDYHIIRAFISEVELHTEPKMLVLRTSPKFLTQLLYCSARYRGGRGAISA